MTVELVDVGPSPNRWIAALDARYRVVHTTEGANSLGWLLNPASEVSYGILIPRTGPRILRLMPEGDAPWHAGAVCQPITTPLYDGTNPNRRAEGWAFEGFARERLSDFQLEAWKWLNATRGPKPWTGHFALAGCNRSDPGLANMAALHVALEEDTMTLTPDQARQLEEVHVLSHRIKNILEHHFKTPLMALELEGAAAGPEREQRGEWDGQGAEPVPPEHRTAARARDRARGAKPKGRK